jgi:hypothetical protein
VAQVYTGSITGLLTDPSGAVVPAGTITITDTTRGFSYTATSNATGRYLVRPLPPSTYRITVQAAGFKEFARDGIVLNVNQNASLDVSLELGTGVQSVDVRGDVAQLATQDSATGQTLDRTYINELPLLGRNVFDLAGLTPGVTQASGGFTIAYHATNFISNGSRNAQTDVLMDGVSTTNYENGTGVLIPLYQPSVDAVQEFKVQQSGFSAETGFSASTVMNLVTRSGTNEVHGTASWFLRNNVLTANDWFSNANGREMAGRHYNRFGATIGGPIKKDKTFYFFNVEGLIDISAATFQAGVPSAAMRKGDFGEICSRGFNSNGMCNDPNGQLWDPYTGVYNPAENGPVRTAYIPFNNMATYMSPGAARLNGTSQQLPMRPGNLIDPVAAKLMDYFPLPNVGVGQANYNRKINWYGVGSNETHGYQYDAKLDHWFSTSDQTSAKYSHQSGFAQGASAYGNLFNPSFSGPGKVNAYLVALNHTHTFTPTMLLTTSAGYTRQFTDQQDNVQNYDEDPISVLGMPDYMRRSGFRGAPAILIDSYASPGVSLGSVPSARLRQATETYNVVAGLSRIQGRHELKTGSDIRMHRINHVQPAYQAGGFAFHLAGTSQHYGFGGGDAMASFLTGVGIQGAYSIPAWVSTQNFAVAGYLQDNWRVNGRLTLNLGLRWDFETPRTERFNRQSFVDLDAVSPLKVPGMPNLKGALSFVDDNNRSPYGSDLNNWAPRFGFAYKLRNDAVIRGGYGIFFAVTQRGASGTGGGGALGFSRDTPWVTNYQLDGQTPCCRLSDPFPFGGPNAPFGSSLGAMSFVGDSISGPTRASILNATPYEQSWTFGFQKEMPANFLIDANYVGKKGTKLYFANSGQFNMLGPEIESYTLAQIADLNTFVPNPFYGILPANSTIGAAPAVTKMQLRRPYPQYTNVTTVPLPVGNSMYHALQLKAEKRFSHGLQALVTYTFSKSIDDSSVGGLTWLAGIPSGLRNPNNRSLERSVSAFDIPHVLGLSYVFELPVGRGKALGNNWHPIVNALFGGWKTNGIWRFSSGQPLAVTFSGSTPLPTYGAQRPDLLARLEKTSNSNFLQQYFANPEVVVKPAPFTLGTAPRTIASVRTPGVNNANLSLLKSFDISWLREGMRTEFRAESFNALNHPQFCGPNTTINSGNFGRVSTTCGPSREVQLGLKLYW